MSGQAAFNKPVRLAAVCTVGAAGKEISEQCKEIELNGVGGERGAMLDDEGELAASDWRVKSGHRNEPTQAERNEQKGN